MLTSGHLMQSSSINPDPLRILHVIPSYLPAVRYGGPMYAVHGLCKHLVQQGHQVDVFTTNVDGLGTRGERHRASMDGVGINYFPVQLPRRIYYSPQLARELEACITNYDVLHLHSLYLYPTLVAARCASRNGIPYLLAPRGMLVGEVIARKNFLLKKAWIHLFERRTLEQASVIQATSHLEAQELRKFKFEWPEILELPNGLECPTLQSGVVRDPNLMLFLGRIDWKKGLDRLIPVLVGLPKMKLLVVGNDETGYTRVLRKIAEKHAVTQQVEFYGPAWGEDKWRLYQQAGMFVLPSYSENFANTVLEAMAAACPVIVSPQVGLAEVVAESGTGIVSHGATDQWAESIHKIADQPELARQMGEAGQRLVAARFSWPTIASQMIDAYRKVLSSRPVNLRAG